jgi:hypothetical protein
MPVKEGHIDLLESVYFPNPIYFCSPCFSSLPTYFSDFVSYEANNLTTAGNATRRGEFKCNYRGLGRILGGCTVG